jgi:KDO2-lipid IV(A) lauroyltransferase
MKRIKYLIEAILACILYFILWLLPMDAASYLGGFILRKLGPWLKASKIADRNIAMCLPEYNAKARKEIICQMWDNLGRIIGELPHWRSVSTKEFHRRIKIENHFKRKKSRAVIFVSGHFGNFELAPKLSHELGYGAELVHRPANNPFVNWLINKSRTSAGADMIGKGLLGVRAIHKIIIEARAIAMLVDQKTNDGIDSEFIGLPAKTTSLPGKLAKKYPVDIVICIMRRTKGAHYNVLFSAPMKFSKKDTPETITKKINDELSEWIIKYPGQWFWVHKRWGK